MELVPRCWVCATFLYFLDPYAVGNFIIPDYFRDPFRCPNIDDVFGLVFIQMSNYEIIGVFQKDGQMGVATHTLR